MALLITDSRGVVSGMPGGNAEAEAALKAGFIQVAPSMYVSLAGARIDVLREVKQ